MTDIGEERRPRLSRWDVIGPVLFGVVLLVAIVAVMATMTVFAADPMAGT